MRDFEETKTRESKVPAREAAQRQRLPTHDQRATKKPATSTDRAGRSQEKTCTVTDGEDG